MNKASVKASLTFLIAATTKQTNTFRAVSGAFYFYSVILLLSLLLVRFRIFQRFNCITFFILGIQSSDGRSLQNNASHSVYILCGKASSR